MWLKRIDENETLFRYRLSCTSREWLMSENGELTICFLLRKFYKNNDGKWEMCSQDDFFTNAKMYVSIETLMSKFILIDSDVDKTITELRKFKHETQAKVLEESLKPFVLGSVEESQDICEQIPQNENGNN